MPFNPEIHHRRSVRLQGYDYTQDGAYFITICTHDRQPMFGDIVGDEMQLNGYGRVVEEEWLQTEVVRPYVHLDSFVIMPNHFHAIIMLIDNPHARGNVGATCQVAPTNTRPNGPKSGSIGAIMAQFKRITTIGINEFRGTQGGMVWQRSFHDEIIRNESHLNAVR